MQATDHDLDIVLKPLSRPELGEIPAGFGHADDGDIEVSALGHGLQCRKNFLVRQIAGRSEQHPRI